MWNAYLLRQVRRRRNSAERLLKKPGFGFLGGRAGPFFHRTEQDYDAKMAGR
jgi:hypothetical protein